MFRDGIYFSGQRKEALTITWSKVNDKLNHDRKVESILINPKRFIECIELHFEQYVKSLRTDPCNEMKGCFLAAVKAKWNLENSDHFIGMTEAEFLKEDM